MFPLNFCYFLVAKVYLIYKDLKGIRQLKIHRSTFYNHPGNDKQNYCTLKLLDENWPDNLDQINFIRLGTQSFETNE